MPVSTQNTHEHRWKTWFGAAKTGSFSETNNRPTNSNSPTAFVNRNFSQVSFSMETVTTQPREPSSSPEATAAAVSPCWVMLRYYNHSWAWDSTTVVSDVRTCAAAMTSRGRHIQVSFNLMAPPAISTFYFDWVGGAPDGNDSYKMESHVIAAHDDCILFDVIVRERYYGNDKVHEVDYFLYEAGASRPPSLSRLPACYFPNLYDDRREPPAKARGMDKDSTGLLRRGEEGLLVAELELPYDDDDPRDTAELCMLRPGCCERAEQCDMAEASPELRYVALPLEALEDTGFEDRPNMQPSRRLVAAGANAVRLVTVQSRCCCGGPGSTTCVRGRVAFTVTTWTLNLTTTDEPTTAMWVKDGVLDCEELWALPGYEGLPRVPVEYPIVSFHDPDVVCFTVSCDYRSYLDPNKRKVWLIEVDMRRKVLCSVVPFTWKDTHEGYNIGLGARILNPDALTG
ncbi:hypothetical protein EJB05_57964, partial [Eragrostis curvula]